MRGQSWVGLISTRLKGAENLRTRRKDHVGTGKEKKFKVKGSMGRVALEQQLNKGELGSETGGARLIGR